MTERISEGESKYNSSLDILQRINKLQEQAIIFSTLRTWDGYKGWQSILDALDRELDPYLNDTEKEAVATVRVSDPVDPSVRRIAKEPPVHHRQRLDKWERTLRGMIVKKNMGIIAKETDSVFILPGGKK